MGAHSARYTFLLKGLKEKMPMVANRHIYWTRRGVPRDLIQYLFGIWMWGYFWETLVVVLEDWLRWSILANVWYQDSGKTHRSDGEGSVLSLQVLVTGALALRLLDWRGFTHIGSLLSDFWRLDRPPAYRVYNVDKRSQTRFRSQSLITNLFLWIANMLPVLLLENPAWPAQCLR